MPLFAGNLKLELAEANSKIIELERKIKQKEEEQKLIEKERDNYKKITMSNTLINSEQQNEIDKLLEQKNSLEKEIENKSKEKEDLDAKITEKKSQYIEFDDAVLLQSFDLYKPQYEFANSSMYKQCLNETREKQKQLIKESKAAICIKQWSVEGSLAKGRKFVEDNIRQILKTFNIECENAINKVKFNNFDSSKKRIENAYSSLNKLNDTNKISIQPEYLDLKIDELKLAYEYSRKVQEEKEELRQQREMQREEQRLAKELEEKRAEIEKEQEHYNNALKRLIEQIEVEKQEERKIVLIEKKEEIENNLIDLDKALKDVDYREANQRAGYVYIISNIGTFGEDIYKIGMTRRLDPQDRIDELGGASVPFRFDVHAFIFSDDAPKLEASLHKAFENKKVNMINGRKEFFNVTLEEIEEVVKKNHDKTVDFKYTADAEQYRESVLIKKGG